MCCEASLFLLLLFGSIFTRNYYLGHEEFCWGQLGKFLGSGRLAESGPGSHSLGVRAECREGGLEVASAFWL